MTKSNQLNISNENFGYIVDVSIGTRKHPYIIMTDKNKQLPFNEEQCMDLIELGETKHIPLGGHPLHWGRFYLRGRYHLEE